MVKTSCETVPIATPRKELLDAAKRFLLHSESHEDFVLLDNIYSPKFGSSDLLFVNKSKTNLTVGRLYDRDGGENFIISSISYYFWLKEFITIGEVFFNETCGLDMYLFSHDFSAASRYLMDNLTKEVKVYLITYKILHVEGVDEPAVYFQHITRKDHAQEKLLKKGREKERVVLTGEQERSAALKISAQELREFDRLKERYLD